MTRPEPDDLIGRWSVDRMPDAEGSLVAPLAGTRIVAEFDAEGIIAGTAGCNVYRGVFEVEGGVVTIDRLATTLRLCARPQGVMEQEERFLITLDRVARCSIRRDSLELFDDSSALLVSMKRDTRKRV